MVMTGFLPRAFSTLRHQLISSTWSVWDSPDSSHRHGSSPKELADPKGLRHLYVSRYGSGLAALQKLKPFCKAPLNVHCTTLVPLAIAKGGSSEMTCISPSTHIWTFSPESVWAANGAKCYREFISSLNLPNRGMITWSHSCTPSSKKNFLSPCKSTKKTSGPLNKLQKAIIEKNTRVATRLHSQRSSILLIYPA